MNLQEFILDESSQQSYKDVSIPINEVLRTGMWLSLGLLFAPLIIFWVMHGFKKMFDYEYSLITLLVALIPVLLVAIAVHEALHAIGWMVAGKFSWQNIAFGVDWRNLAPYAHAKVPMKATAYRIGGALPGIVTGLLPTVVGILQADGLLTLFGAFMLSAAVGDILVLWVIRGVAGDARVLDHPSNAGCLVLID